MVVLSLVVPEGLLSLQVGLSLDVVPVVVLSLVVPVVLLSLEVVPVWLLALVVGVVVQMRVVQHVVECFVSVRPASVDVLSTTVSFVHCVCGSQCRMVLCASLVGGVVRHHRRGPGWRKGGRGVACVS